MLSGGSSFECCGLSGDRSKNYFFSVEQSEEHGTNWNEGRSIERVHEYTVKPTVLQSLPDNALLLVRRSSNTMLQSVESDREIVTFPQLTTSPHAPVAGSRPPVDKTSSVAGRRRLR